MTSKDFQEVWGFEIVCNDSFLTTGESERDGIIDGTPGRRP